MAIKQTMAQFMPWNWGKKPLDAPHEHEELLRRSADGPKTHLEHLFGQLAPFEFGPFSPLRATRDGPASVWPPVDVEQTESEVRITVELPGIDQKDLEVTIGGDLLTIREHKDGRRTSRANGFTRTESHCGAFDRLIRLPTPVDEQRAKATYNRGELIITVPKKQAPAQTNLDHLTGAVVRRQGIGRGR